MKFFNNLSLICTLAAIVSLTAVKCRDTASNEEENQSSVLCSGIVDMAKCLAPKCKNVDGTCFDACSKVASDECGEPGARKDCRLENGVCTDLTKPEIKSCNQRTAEECVEDCKLLPNNTCNVKCESVTLSDCGARSDCAMIENKCVDKTAKPQEEVDICKTHKEQETCLKADCKFLPEGNCLSKCSKVDPNNCGKDKTNGRVDCQMKHGSCVDKAEQEIAKEKINEKCMEAVSKLSTKDATIACRKLYDEKGLDCLAVNEKEKCIQFPTKEYCSTKNQNSCRATSECHYINSKCMPNCLGIISENQCQKHKNEGCAWEKNACGFEK